MEGVLTKSNVICNHGRLRMGGGWSRPAGGELTLFCAHTGQAVTYSWTSLTRDRHQNRHWSKFIIELDCVSPVDDFSSNCCGDVQLTGRPWTGVRFLLLDFPDQPFYLPCQQAYDGCSRENGLLLFFSFHIWYKLAREGIRLHIPRSQPVSHGEVKSG